MAEDRKSFVIKESENGGVNITDEVVAIIAGLAATEVEGVSSLAGNLTNEVISKAGMNKLSKGVKIITEEENKMVVSLFESFGKAEIVPESLMDAVVGVSGSSPAYVYMFIEAMADAAVNDGMPRAQAYKFAAQSVLGAAKMVLETGKHPGELKDAVCSPAGTTIAAVAKLEEGSFRSTVIAAQNACSEKSRAMSKLSD